jgi:hypothetical protein
MEAGTSKWNVNGSTQWSQTSTSWKSWTHAWKTDGSTKNGLLSLAAPLNFTNYSSLWLVFNTAYALKNGQSFNLEVSTDGNHWTILKTYTGSSAYWSTEMVDLSAYRHTANVRLRFNAQSNPGSLWLIDDVYVYGESKTYLFLPFVERR